MNEDKKEIGKNIASKIVYIHLHEINGHKKYTYKRTCKIGKFIKNLLIFLLIKKSVKKYWKKA